MPGRRQRYRRRACSGRRIAKSKSSVRDVPWRRWPAAVKEHVLDALVRAPRKCEDRDQQQAGNQEWQLPPIECQLAQACLHRHLALHSATGRRAFESLVLQVPTANLNHRGAMVPGCGNTSGQVQVETSHSLDPGQRAPLRRRAQNSPAPGDEQDGRPRATKRRRCLTSITVIQSRRNNGVRRINRRPAAPAGGTTQAEGDSDVRSR